MWANGSFIVLEVIDRQGEKAVCVVTMSRSGGSGGGEIDTSDGPLIGSKIAPRVQEGRRTAGLQDARDATDRHGKFGRARIGRPSRQRRGVCAGGVAKFLF